MAKGSGKTKNLRYGDAIEELFDDSALDLSGDEIMEPVFEIDTEAIDRDANTLASGIISNVAKVYASEDFLKEHPDFRKRLDSEIQSLKMHYKMRAVDEKIQDELVRAIGRKGDNASLYAVLPKLQTAMTNTQNKIDATMDRIQNLLKSYQTELNFEDDNDEDYEEEDENDETNQHSSPLRIHSTTTRGTKEFIEKYKNMSIEDVQIAQS